MNLRPTLRTTVCVFSLLLLTACATKPTDKASSDQTAEAAPNPPSKTVPTPPRTAIYPGGPLLAITANSAKGQPVAELNPPRDLWERIRRGYGIPNLDSDLVRDREQWYTARPDYMVRMTERGRKYLFHVVEELERRNMPTELALLPFIESAFNPQAVSSAKAAGMWQFVPATGKYFDLKQNVFRDDRRDVLASTRAALDYLQKLYGMFGDWQLALAAYNWGEGSVQRAIAKNQRAGLGTTYSDLNMPMETRMYIPKLQAVKNIVASPEAVGVQLPEIFNHPYFQQVPITRDIDVALAAKLADVKFDDFKALNPSANRPVILAAGTPQILLPWDNATIFQQNLEAYTGGRLASWTAWIAPTTMKPVDAARQAGMGETEFRTINNIPQRMLVKAGSTLLVPRHGNQQADVTIHVADNAQLSLAPEIVLRKSLVKANKADTVASVAQRYNVSASSVAQWNQVSAQAAFKKGQQVVVFLPIKTHTVMAKAAPTQQHGNSNAKQAKAPVGKQATAKVASNVTSSAPLKAAPSNKIRVAKH
jgi:membrane-bound lytic murein transglycosylase D